jgi:hypothetical protein
MSINFHWSSEVYSLGKTYREYYKLPKWLPLPFYSDHGPMQSGIIDSQIIEECRFDSLYFTFSKKCLTRNTEVNKIKIFGTLHPWVSYREKNFKPSNNPKSFVIFFPLHTTPDYITTGVDDVSSIKYLSEIREAGYKVIICIHWHDLGGAREVLFRENGFETTSLGNPYDKNLLINSMLLPLNLSSQ